MLHFQRARTLAITRFLRAAAPAQHRRRGGRLPRQLQPDAIRGAYFAAIWPELRAQAAPMRAIGPELVRLLAEQRAAEQPARADASERERRAAEMVERAAREAARAFRPTELYRVAEQFGRRTGAFQREQLDRQVRQAIGVPFSAIERPIRDLVPVFAKANVELIKTVPDRYHDRLAKETQEAFESGEHPATFAARLIELDDMAEGDAMRIARDQIGKLNGQFNQERQEAMGVTGGIWRGAMDNRERDSHRDLEGEHFEWDDPPTDEETGEVITPGSAIQCRCYAEPDFSPILDQI